jgi:hypothetical protein
MGWWSAGGRQDEVLGDDSADAVNALLANLGRPPLQDLLDTITALLKSKREFALKKLTARLSDGRTMESSEDATANPHLVEGVLRGVDSIIAIYRDDLERPPTLREVLQNFVFVLGYKPERYLSGMEGLTVNEIASS